VATKFLIGAAVVVAVLIVGLGAAGWVARDDARAKHQEATVAADQAELCRDLGTVVKPLSGGLSAAGVDFDFEIPAEIREGGLTDSADFLNYQLETVVIPESPPVLQEPLQTISDAAAETAQDLSIAPFTTADAQRAVQEVIDWYGEAC
jgi:hypothetical protein